MMNKKAIAAFAAGATLLAGFAMATPAMAETPTSTNPVADATLISAMKATIEKDKADIAKARDWEARVSSAYTNAKDKAAEADGSYKFATLTDDGHDLNPDTTVVAADKADAEVTKLENAALKASDDIDAAVAKLAADEAYLAQLEGKTPTPTPDHTTPDHTTPVQPAKPGSKLEAVKNVLAKKVDVDAASHVFAEKKEAYTKAAATLTAAKAELDAAEHDAAVAAQNLSDFEASGVNDSAKLQSLKEAVARADAHVVRTTTAFNKALADFNDAKTADLAAQAAYNAAKAAYDEAYNAAIKLGVNPALLPSVTAVDPLSPAFPQLAQAQKIYADALAGKFGAAAQKAVQKAEAAKAQAAAPAAAAGKAGAAAGKAAAKGELATKGGNGHGGKAGEKLGNAGVGVALTALAASMLAGMGAAVRKMRH
ncbi:hypothetical protein AXE75_03565 [Gardnerella vaginalis]|uniref:hypothetical protein n=1 Tax=Gardnerella vaginalis TaxID=2702 RepID=UPI000E3246F7|nr:hypothetical protein [Gardnerella vaginalis]RFD76394.1 hypothetical protein AXE75_03565 [Gardnerella vaginalis]